VWALWLANRATDFEAPNGVREIGKLKLYTTTLVMRA
jgi:hypothetical protein